MKKSEQFGNRVKQARLAKEVSQAYLASQIGTQQQTIQRIEANLTKTSLFTVAIAKVLDVSADWLQYGSKSKVALKELPSYDNTLMAQQNGIPLLEWSEVKEWCKAKGGFALGKDREFIRLQYAGSNSYALRINNDAMVAPRGNMKSFHKGNIIIVDPDKQLKDDCYVIVQPTDAKEASFKQYVRDGGVEYLKSINPQYPMLKKDKTTKVYGVVIACLDLLL